MARAAPAAPAPSDLHSASPLSQSAETTIPEAEVDLLSFFPATHPDFVCRAGAVAAVRKEDFENEHRARHLRSFQRSMREWGDFNPDLRNAVDSEVTTQFTLQLLSRNPQTADEFNQVCAELRKAFKAAPSKAQIIASYEALLHNASEHPDSLDADEIHENGEDTVRSGDASCSSKVGESAVDRTRVAGAEEEAGKLRITSCHVREPSPSKGEEHAALPEATTCSGLPGQTGGHCCSSPEEGRVEEGSECSQSVAMQRLSGDTQPGGTGERELAPGFHPVSGTDSHSSVDAQAFSSLQGSSASVLSATSCRQPGRLPFRRNRVLENLMKRKAIRTNSGVLVITVLTSPGRFSCPQDCHYCPNEPGQPRSYLSTEPAVLRANQNGWDAVRQFHDRANTLQGNGHTVDKIEVLVLGGTWSGYPSDYQEEFVRDLFYAANVFDTIPPFRPRLSLEEEQTANESAGCRIIGLTLETRPDFINRHELRKLRRFGCTRVQLGLQHVENDVLKYINRGCERRDAIRAIRMLKDSGYKVDVHIMPDLPSSSPEKDLLMFFYLLSSSDLQADQWKVYPCEVTPFSEIEKWYAEGRFVPYAEKEGGRELVNLLLRVKAAVHPWIRLNRVVRDIPNQSIIAGNDVTNLRQVLYNELQKRELVCRCIRCREVKDKAIDVQQGAVLKAREYESNGGQEIFLSFETADEATILGFLRLRLCSSVQRSKKDMPFSCLAGAALLRELHVYGSLVAHGESKTDCDVRPQHAGLGRRLIQAAEILAMSRGFFRMAVIAGVGTREYYRKHGYELRDTYMLKELTPPPPPFVNASLLGLPLPEKIQIKKVSLLSAGKLLLAPLPPPLTTRKKQPRQTSRKKRHSQPGRAASGCEGESKVQSELKPDGNGEGRRPFTRSAGEVPIEPASHYNGGCWAGRVGLVECDTSRQDWLKSRRTEWQDAGDVQLVDVAEALGRARDVLLQNRDSDRRTVDATQYPISDNYEDPDSFAKFSELYPDILSQVEEVCEASVEVSCQGPALETCQAATAVGGLKNHSHVVEKLQTSWRAWKQSCLNCLVGVKQLRFSTATWVSVGFAIMVGCSLAVLRVRRR